MEIFKLETDAHFQSFPLYDIETLRNNRIPPEAEKYFSEKSKSKNPIGVAFASIIKDMNNSISQIEYFANVVNEDDSKYNYNFKWGDTLMQRTSLELLVISPDKDHSAGFDKVFISIH